MLGARVSKFMGLAAMALGVGSAFGAGQFEVPSYSLPPQGPTRRRSKRGSHKQNARRAARRRR